MESRVPMAPESAASVNSTETTTSNQTQTSNTSHLSNNTNENIQAVLNDLQNQTNSSVSHVQQTVDMYADSVYGERINQEMDYEDALAKFAKPGEETYVL